MHSTCFFKILQNSIIQLSNLDDRLGAWMGGGHNMLMDCGRHELMAPYCGCNQGKKWRGGGGC